MVKVREAHGMTELCLVVHTKDDTIIKGPSIAWDVIKEHINADNTLDDIGRNFFGSWLAVDRRCQPLQELLHIGLFELTDGIPTAHICDLTAADFVK